MLRNNPDTGTRGHGDTEKQLLPVFHRLAGSPRTTPESMRGTGLLDQKRGGARLRVGVCLMLLTVISTSAHAAIFFRMNCADGTLNCNWGYVPTASPYYTMTLVPNGGPAGQAAVQFTQTPQPAGSGQVQYYLGWARMVDQTPPPQGSVRYIRFLIKPNAPFNFSGTGDVWTDKFIILGDGANALSRVICQMRDDFPAGGNGNGLSMACTRNIDGIENGAQTGALINDQWNWVQIEIRSSTSGSQNARIAIWTNRASYNSPTSQSTAAFELQTSQWYGVALGYYANTALASNGRVLFQVASFEYGDQFDSNWIASGTPPPPPPPPPSNACDLNNQNGVTVVDVQLCVNQALTLSPCTTGDIDRNSQCNVLDVQRVVNSALGEACVTQ